MSRATGTQNGPKICSAMVWPIPAGSQVERLGTMAPPEDDASARAGASVEALALVHYGQRSSGRRAACAAVRQSALLLYSFPLK
jgi:hypothetical protein